MSGKLILLSDDGKEESYEPVNNLLHVGSDESANVCLNGLKPTSFAISIDTFGRVTIRPFMKRVTINGKRYPKNVTRPLMNNSLIEIKDYRLRWEYNPKFSKSYSMSPCGKSNLTHDIESTIRNRKTMSCFTTDVNDENKTAGNEEEINIQEPEKTPAKKVVNDNVKEATSTKKRASLLPVKENRTSELRRASIVKTIFQSDDTKSLQFVTPKKPIPSATMVKSVNAIMRTELRGKDASISSSRVAKRNTLGSGTIFPSIIGKMDLFNVVTDEMKTVGPSAYLSNKFAATNSPKRTPRKMLQKQKRQSLQSEVSEMGLYKPMPKHATSKEEEQGKTVLTNTSPTNVNTLESENDEDKSTTQQPAPTVATPMDVYVQKYDDEEIESTTQEQPANALESENESEQKSITAVPSASIEVINETVECFVVSDDDEDDKFIPEEVEIVTRESAETSGDDSSSCDSVISVDDDDDDCSDSGGHIDQTASSLTTASSNMDTDGDIESPAYEVLSKTDSTASTDSTPELNNEKSPAEVQDTTNSSTEVSTEQLPSPFTYESSSEVLTDGNASQVSSMSTPTKRQSLIRNRRNSRLCSLDECCSPAVLGTPTKNKLTSNVVSTPRSILKTPKATKTPKKNVRILETIVHEEEDENSGRSSVNPIETANLLDVKVEKDGESEINHKSQISSTEQPIESVEIESINEVVLAEQGDVTEKRRTVEQTEPSNALDVTFEKECGSEINNSTAANKSQISSTEQPIESNNEVVLAEQGVENEKRKTVEECEPSNAFDVTFEKECDSEINNSTAANKSQISTVEQPIESVEIESNNEVLLAEQRDETEKRRTIKQTEPSNALDVTFDKDDTVEVDKINDDVFPVKQVAVHQHSSVNPAETSNLLNLTFDKESNDEVNKSQAASQSSDPNSAAEHVEETCSMQPVEAVNLLEVKFDKECEKEVNDSLAAEKSSAQCKQSVNEQNQADSDEKTIEFQAGDETIVKNNVDSRDELVLVEKQSEVPKPMIRSESVNLFDVTLERECDLEKNSPAIVKNTPTSIQSNEQSVELDTQEALEKTVVFNEEAHASVSDLPDDKIETNSNNEAVVLKKETGDAMKTFRAKSSFDATSDMEHDNRNDTASSHETSLLVRQAREQYNALIANEDDLPKLTSTEMINVASTVECDIEENNQPTIDPQPHSNENIEKTNAGLTNELELSIDGKMDSDSNNDSVLRGQEDDISDPSSPKKNDTSNLTESFEVNSSGIDEEFTNQPHDESIDTKNDANTPINPMNSSSCLIGVRELMFTPKPHDKTNLVGMKELLNTPDDTHPLDDVRGVKELMNTPKPHDKTNFVGMKELLNTPDDTHPLDDVRGVKELMNSPKPHDKTNFVGMKELLNTPDDTHPLDDVRGVKELMNTPKPHDQTNFVGLKELLNTPDDTHPLDDVRGVKELMNSPKPHDKKNFVGMKELFKTPKAVDKTDLLGIKELVDTPQQTNYQLTGVKELLKTPREIDLDGVSEMLKTPIASNSSTAPLPNVTTEDSTSFKITDLKFKSRESFIVKVNEALSHVGAQFQVDARETNSVEVSKVSLKSGPANDSLKSGPANDESESGPANDESESGPANDESESEEGALTSTDNSENITEKLISKQEANIATDSEVSKSKNVDVPTSSEGKIVEDAGASISVVPTAVIRPSRRKQPTAVTVSKSAKSKESSKQNSEMASVEEEKSLNDKPPEVDSSQKSEPPAPTLKRRRKQANEDSKPPVEDSKPPVVDPKPPVVDPEPPKAKELRSKKVKEAPTSSKINEKNIGEEETSTNAEAKIPKKSSKQNKTSSERQTETEYKPTPVARKGRKKIVDNSEASQSTESEIDSAVPSLSQNNDETKEKKASTRSGRSVKELKSAETSKPVSVTSSSKTPKRSKRTAEQNTADEIEEQIDLVVIDDSTKPKKTVKDSKAATSTKSEEPKTETLNITTRRQRQKSVVLPASERTTRRGAKYGTSVEPEKVVDVPAQVEMIVDSETTKKKGKTAKVPTSSSESIKIIAKDTAVDKGKKVPARLDTEVESVETSEYEDVDEPPAKTKKRNIRSTKKGVGVEKDPTASANINDMVSKTNDTLNVPTRERRQAAIAATAGTSKVLRSKSKQRDTSTAKTSETVAEQTIESSNETTKPSNSKQSSTKVVPDESEAATSKKNTRALSKRLREPSEVDEPEPATKKQYPKRKKEKVSNEEKSEEEPVQPKVQGKKNEPAPKLDQESEEPVEMVKASKKKAPEKTQPAVTRKESNRGHETSDVEVEENSSVGTSKRTKANAPAEPRRKRLRSTNVTEGSTPAQKKRPTRGAK